MLVVGTGLVCLGLTVVLGVVVGSPFHEPGSPQPASTPQSAAAASPSVAAGQASPTARASQPAVTAAPVALPAPFLGRLEGNFLVSYTPDTAGAAAGLYPVDELLVVKPTCKKGACSSGVVIKDPLTGKAIGSATFELGSDGYRLKHSASRDDQCRGADGLTVEDGITARSSTTLTALTRPGIEGPWLEGDRSVSTKLASPGTAVECGSGTFAFSVESRRVERADLGGLAASVTQPPLPDLVERPDDKVTIPGVHMVYFAVKGTGAGELMDAWAATSSRSKYCGRVGYSWYEGSGETLSCAKVSWTTSYRTRTYYSTGACTVTSVSIKVRYSMPIARWTGPSVVPRALVPWWKATQRMVRDHEAGHFALDRRWLSTLRHRLLGARCSSVKAIQDKVSRQLSAAQEAYDKEKYATEVFPAYPPDAR